MSYQDRVAADGRQQCALDSKGCLGLDRILCAFNFPISEEQAWAVCYQTVKCIINELENSDDDSECFQIKELSDIRINKDGCVHPACLRAACHVSGTGNPREKATSEHQIVQSLGLVIFHALDHSLSKDETVNMGQALEVLLDRMTSADSGHHRYRRGGKRPAKRRPKTSGSPRKRRSSVDHDDSQSSSSSSSENEDEAFHDDDHPDDEGIERDHEETEENDKRPLMGKRHSIARVKHGLNLAKVLEICASQLATPVQADTHFKAVCRALVAEALELSSFLQKIAKGGTHEFRKSSRAFDETDSRLDNLLVQDWARLWVQVIRELRDGVKLKKIPNDFPHPYEYELTPFEMLLDDIRSRRYKLKKIMVNGDLPPRVKKDAHAMILDFIRSRPPLVPAANRVLAPRPSPPPTLYEKLMTSIRQQHKLKPTISESTKNVDSSQLKTDSSLQKPAVTTGRRLIKPDLSLRLSASFDDDDDDDYDDFPITPTMDEPMSLPAFSSKSMAKNNQDGPAFRSSDRRHSVIGYENPPLAIKSSTKQTSPSCVYSDNYWACSQWRSLECLSLTLEEVVHIRNVLTKAELESVVGNRAMYEDLEKGKICFTCKTVRFSLFGAWGHKCKLCERNVCVKCSNKMKVPTEHFAKIPVYMLSPVPSPPYDSEHSSLPFWTTFTNGSSDSDSNNPNPSKSNSPTTTTTQSPDDKSPERPQSGSTSQTTTPTKQHNKLTHSESFTAADASETKTRKRAPLMRSKTVQVKASSPIYDVLDAVNGGQRLTGPLVSVCRDCKDLVRHIMESRNQAPDARPNIKPRTLSCAPYCLAPVTESPTTPATSPMGNNRSHFVA